MAVVGVVGRSKPTAQYLLETSYPPDVCSLPRDSLKGPVVEAGAFSPASKVEQAKKIFLSINSSRVLLCQLATAFGHS